MEDDDLLLDDVPEEALIHEIETVLRSRQKQEASTPFRAKRTKVTKSDEDDDDDASTTETDSDGFLEEENPWLIATSKDATESEKNTAYWNLCYPDRVILHATKEPKALSTEILPLKSCMSSKKNKKQRQNGATTPVQFSESSAVTYSADDPVQNSLHALENAKTLFPIDVKERTPQEERDILLTRQNHAILREIDELYEDDEESIDLELQKTKSARRQTLGFRFDESFRMDSSESLGLSSFDGGTTTTTTMGMTSIPLDFSDSSLESSVSSLGGALDASTSSLTIEEEESGSSIGRLLLELKQQYDERDTLTILREQTTCGGVGPRQDDSAPPESVTEQLKAIAEYEWKRHETLLLEKVDQGLDDQLEILQTLHDTFQPHMGLDEFKDDIEALECQLEEQKSQHRLNLSNIPRTWKASLQYLLYAKLARFRNESTLELVFDRHGISISVQADGTTHLEVLNTSEDFYGTFLRKGIKLLFPHFELSQFPKLVIFLGRLSDATVDVCRVAESINVSEICISIKAKGDLSILYDLTQPHLVFSCLPSNIDGIEEDQLRLALEQSGLTKLLQTLCLR